METFDRFVLERKQDLKRIARHTRGENAFDDVVSEAWLMTVTVPARKRVAIDVLDAAFQKLLPGYLCQHLVRYTELNVRRAVLLDQPWQGDDGHARPSIRL